MVLPKIMRNKVLNLDRTFELLLSFGFSQTEARIYLHLVSKGPAKARDIIDTLDLNKQQLYRSLKKLRQRRIVDCLGSPAIFNAEPVEQVLIMLTNKKREEAELIEERKADLLSTWKSFNMKKNGKDQ
jgi:sugar-specific transcriptional regulator TrmB